MTRDDEKGRGTYVSVTLKGIARLDLPRVMSAGREAGGPVCRRETRTTGRETRKARERPKEVGGRVISAGRDREGSPYPARLRPRVSLFGAARRCSAFNP